MVERHSQRIEWVCWHYANGEVSLFKDLMQESLLVLWHRHESLREGSNSLTERAWVTWQCRSACSRFLRHKTPRWVSLDEVTEIPDEDSDHGELIEELAEDLNPKEQEFLKHTLKGLKPKEIASAMHIDPAEVSRIRYRMVEKMRKTYEKHYKS